MRLNDPLATSIFFNEKEYQLDLSFNRVLDVLEVIERKDILEAHKLPIIMSILIGNSDLEYSELLKLWELIRDTHINLADKKHIVKDLQGNVMPNIEEDDSEKVLDIQQDAKYIYASFRQIGINLFAEQNKMHWSEFQALLESLPDDTIMQKIIQIRVWTPQKHDSPKYKAQMKKLQEKYILGKVGEINDE
ncbi:Gp15 family bacteriophage protein [Vagococcus fluvialis]|uniref:Gp15 family bacteriophage protein n=1 Tax=Vagococcus fluvialis TaxID=2738 RepID=UPI00288EEEF1|nr:Gp15 family bacteriophage protein [Vagococcus fluvialis]MDT2781385.1 Gp15 family bacteriophage protein [Vagococcus fluvialis]